jgi:hypothetical protein
MTENDLNPTFKWKAAKMLHLPTANIAVTSSGGNNKEMFLNVILI